MKKYHCYYCNSEVYASSSWMTNEIPYPVSDYCHISTEFICSNLDCETIHIEIVDINDNLLYFGPLKNEEGL